MLTCLYLQDNIVQKIRLWGEIVAYKKQKFGDYRERINFAKSSNTLELADLLEIQKKSYQNFIENGIKETFEDLFPVESFTGNISLEFGEYSLKQYRYAKDYYKIATKEMEKLK